MKVDGYKPLLERQAFTLTATVKKVFGVTLYTTLLRLPELDQAKTNTALNCFCL